MPCSALKTASQVRHETVDQAIQHLTAIEELGRVGAGRLAQVVVQVPVTQMAERHRPDTRHGLADGRICRSQKLCHARHRNRYIVLDTAALMLLGLGNAVAHAPESIPLRLAGGYRTIADQPVVQAMLQKRQ